MASGSSIVSQMPLKGRIGIAGANSKRLGSRFFALAISGKNLYRKCLNCSGIFRESNSRKRKFITQIIQ